MKVGFVSLGCSKNLIDTEATIGRFKEHNYEIVNDEKKADVIVINTCGFIDSAKEEAINTILEMAEHKNEKCRYLIVMGCLVQRYKEDLEKLLPEVDLFIKIDEYDELWEKIENLLKRGIIEKSKKQATNKISEIPVMPMLKQEEFMGRVITTGNNYAYLKIGEGCSNKCTYCAIPYIRGPFVSRKQEDILEEAKMLAKKGIKEIIVIAQDTTKYGVDIYGECKLPELLEQLTQIEGIEWVRFLYSYPEGITNELIEVVSKNNKIAKYFDIPMQHISNPILKKMNRKTTKEKTEELIKNIRTKIPEVVLRTSLIVGFPGETKENFEELLEFVKETKFDKLGVFPYSKEDGTPAARLKEQIHPATKKKRYNLIMSVAKDISAEKLKSYIGKEYKVLVEDTTFDHKFCVGRSYMDIPDTDGMVIIKNCDTKLVGEFVNCKVTAVNNYDLIAKISNK